MRPVFCRLIVCAALVGAASFHGCGRLGYEPLVTDDGDANPTALDDGAVDGVVVPVDGTDAGHGGSGGFDSGGAGGNGGAGGEGDAGGPRGPRGPRNPRGGAGGDGGVAPSDADVIDGASGPGPVDGGVAAKDAQVIADAPAPATDVMSGNSGSFISGQYLGTGMAGLKVTGLGFAPDVVFVHARLSSPSLFATRLMSGRTRLLPDFNATAMTDIVTGFDADGFELGSKWANVSGVVGDYLALKATPGSVAVGRFTGDGQSRVLSGLGFAPGYVFVACDGRPPMHRSRTMDTTIHLSGNAEAKRITSLDGDGFSLGHDPDVNQSGTDCQWFAVREGTGAVATTSFVGNKTAGRLVMLPGGLPQAVFVQCEAPTGQHWVWKPLSLGADIDASYTLGNAGPQTNMVQRLLSGGFEIGTDANVNIPGLPCHAVGFGG